jgi:hypothetical protein
MDTCQQVVAVIPRDKEASVAPQRQRRSILSSFVMDAEDRARKLCERAAASQDPDELDESLAQLNALLHEHIARLQAMIEQRRLRVDLERLLGKSA